MPKFPWPAKYEDTQRWSKEPRLCLGCNSPIELGQSITQYEGITQHEEELWHSWCYVEYTTKGKGLTHG